jgi:hypothetical protein
MTDCIISACPILAKEKYVKLKGRMHVLRYNICKTIVVELDKDHWYKHIQKSLESSLESKVTVLWNQQMKTDNHP